MDKATRRKLAAWLLLVGAAGPFYLVWMYGRIAEMTGWVIGADDPYAIGSGGVNFFYVLITIASGAVTFIGMFFAFGLETESNV